MKITKSITAGLLACASALGSIAWIKCVFGSDVSHESWFFQYGWLFLVSLFVWAILASNRLAHAQNLKKLAEAKTPTNTVGHSKLKTGETLINKQGGLRLAFDKKTHELMRTESKDGQHGLIAGATGAGKGLVMIGQMLDLAGRASIIYVDPTGNTSAVVHQKLSKAGRFILCNPYENQKGLFPRNMKLPASTSYCEMRRLSPDNYGFTVECERIARTFVDFALPSNENSAHFRDRAVALIAGIIMHVCDRYPPHLRHLTTVRNVLTSSNGEDLWLFLLDAKENGPPYCQQKLARYAALDEDGRMIARYSKEVADVIGTAERYTEWFGNEEIGPSLEEDGFQYETLKDECITVGLICPIQYMHEGGGKWLKHHVTSAIHHLWRDGRGKVPVYLFLDESDLYADPIIAAALNTARKFGINIIIVVQQISDIENRYGKQAGAILNGTSWKLFFSSDDERTRMVVQNLSGTRSVMVPSISLPDGSHGTGKLSFGEQGMPLKPGYELGELAKNECILHVRGLGMLEAYIKPYWDGQDETVEGAGDDPYET